MKKAEWYITTKGTDIRKINESSIGSDEWEEIIGRFSSMIKEYCAKTFFFKDNIELLKRFKDNNSNTIEWQLVEIEKFILEHPQYIRTEKDVSEMFMTQHTPAEIFHPKDKILNEVRGIPYVYNFLRMCDMSLDINKKKPNPFIHTAKVNPTAWSDFAIKQFFLLGGFFRTDASNKKYLPLIKDLKVGECERCHKIFKLKQIELHHFDGNHFNNYYKNMIYCCSNCHAEFHAEMKGC